ncbi:hypothetical protein EJ08DRAFT_644578 [Tothia fuscella]|uniref:Uncharacterized protein n=1 Tax=Tothia fuscella TaxID=1048955 RepID=A0A9P4U5F3_9PEZI|nr:hypothetical protein EJ08DRAFT_644578 [Tothia fuscella]
MTLEEPPKHRKKKVKKRVTWYTPTQPNVQYYPVAAPAAPPPAPAPPAPAPIYYPQPQPAYYPYPTGYYPPAPPAPALAAAPKKYDWWGRTRDEVLHDNQVAAAATGGNDAHQWAPQGVADDTMFHVLEKDGVSQTLYPIGTIKSLKGYWNTHNGVLYFVRNKD